MKRYLLVLTIFVLASVMFNSCAGVGKNEPPYANGIVEEILLGINENDYAKFSAHFDSTMKTALPESAFEKITGLKAVIGEYTPGSKKFIRADRKQEYIVVLYKAKFTNEEKDVIVTVSFREIKGEPKVSGLWFASPKLMRGK